MLDPMSLVGGATALTGLLEQVFGGNSDMEMYKNRANDLRNINSDYYKARTNAYYQKMFDAALKNANILQQKAVQNGLSMGDSMSNYAQNRKQSYADAGEQTNSFMNNLYGQGQEQAMKYDELYGQAQLHKSDQTKQFANQLMGLGGGLLANSMNNNFWGDKLGGNKLGGEGFATNANSLNGNSTKGYMPNTEGYGNSLGYDPNSMSKEPIPVWDQHNSGNIKNNIWNSPNYPYKPLYGNGQQPDFSPLTPYNEKTGFTNTYTNFPKPDFGFSPYNWKNNNQNPYFVNKDNFFGRHR